MNLALHRLHEAGWTHGEITPRNIIVVGNTAKISGLELAKKCAVNELDEMTRSVVGLPSPVERNIRTVGFPLSSSVNRADPNQRDVRFMAVEVEYGRYFFRPGRSKDLGEGRAGESWRSMVKRKGKEMTEPPKDGDDMMERFVVFGADRTLRYNPLHDYESVWWVAVWFVFCCRPEGTTDEEMERARNAVYESRYATFGADVIRTACLLLPGILRPLGVALVEMRDTLVNAYLAFETSFDGSEILSVHWRSMEHLFLLFQRAQKLAVEPSTPNEKVDVEVKPFDTDVLKEEQGQQAMEQVEGTSGWPKHTDDPFVGAQKILGTRPRVDSSPKVDRMLKPKTNHV